jgi:polyferredoxin
MPAPTHILAVAKTLRGPDRLAALVGDWLSRNQHVLRRIQWIVVGFYLLLVVVPAVLPLPPRTAHVWTNLTLFAQFVFWGLWWPFVLLSMLLVGRLWCGVFCPEGTLTEFASRRSLGRAVPRWLSWRGWPFVAFACTTIYGQMVSVYQYPRPVLVVLGGSTLAAVIVGLLYGRQKRVWCRYLCPVNGVFTVLAKLAPLSFQVDGAAWEASRKPGGISPGRVNCAPLVPIRTMKGAGLCHMCGRCSGFRGAVRLAVRSPNHEIVHVAGQETNRWETVLILFGMMGVAVGAFHWSASPWLVSAKEAAAAWLVDHDVIWPLGATAPWWALTNYPGQNDVLSLLDGVLLVGYILLTAVAFGLSFVALLGAATRLAGRWSSQRFHHFAQTMIPMAGCGVFLGLTATTVTLLRAENLTIPFLSDIRGTLLAAAALWSVWLGWQVAGLSAHGVRRAGATVCLALASGLATAGWGLLFWIW